MKVLIFGQSGAGKTTLCRNVVQRMGDRVVHINADEIRKEANDWDFSEQGRWRQYRRILKKYQKVVRLLCVILYVRTSQVESSLMLT